MQEFFFLFFYILFPIVWYFFLKFSKINIFTISIPSFLVISIFIYQYLGFPILFFYLDDYRASLILERAIIWEIFLWTSLTITLIFLGFVIAYHKFKTENLISYNYSLSVIKSCDQFQKLMLIILFVLSVSVLYLYLSKVGWDNIALLSSIGVYEIEFSDKALRSSMGNAFEGKYHWYRLFMRDFLSIVSVAFFGQWLINKKFFSFLIFFISFVICVFSMLMAIEKGPILWYLISLYLIYILIFNQGNFRFNHLILIGLFTIILIGIMYIYFMNSKNLLFGIERGISRIITGSMQPLYFYLEIFPEKVSFLGGRSFPNPGGIYPYESLSLTTMVHNIIFPEYLEKGITGSSPTFFWGEMYANFGYLGIIFPPFFIGYLLYWFNKILLSLPKNPLVISFFIWIVLHYKNLAVSSLSSFIIDIKMIIVTSILILIISIPNKFKIKYLKS